MSWPARSARVVLTKAVLPVPGEPEMYKADVFLAEEVPSMKPRMKAWISERSCSRPAICGPSLHVGRSSARARTWKGRSREGGVAGGVARESWEREVAGVVAAACRRLDVDAYRRGASDDVSNKQGDHGVQLTALTRGSVVDHGACSTQGSCETRAGRGGRVDGLDDEGRDVLFVVVAIEHGPSGLCAFWIWRRVRSGEDESTLELGGMGGIGGVNLGGLVGPLAEDGARVWTWGTHGECGGGEGGCVDERCRRLGPLSAVAGRLVVDGENRAEARVRSAYDGDDTLSNSAQSTRRVLSPAHVTDASRDSLRKHALSLQRK